MSQGSNRRLSDGDKTFLKLIDEGKAPSPAFREAYPDHPAVLQWLRAESGSPDRRKAQMTLRDAAQTKLKAKYMKNALTTYQDSMDRFSELSVETAIELVKGARSEKVRADLAIEGMRHKVGSPTVKMAIQEDMVVHLSFSPPPPGETLPTPTVVESELSDPDDIIDI